MQTHNFSLILSLFVNQFYHSQTEGLVSVKSLKIWSFMEWLCWNFSHNHFCSFRVLDEYFQVTFSMCRIRGLHRGVYGEFHLLGCNALLYVENKPTFRRNMSLFCLLPDSCWFIAWLFLRPQRWKLYVPLKRRLSFSGLHDLVTQNIELISFYVSILFF
jgi:hypothetical protein